MPLHDTKDNPRLHYILFLRLAPIGATFSQINRTYNTIYFNKFLPPPGFEPRSLDTVSRWLINYGTVPHNCITYFINVPLHPEDYELFKILITFICPMLKNPGQISKNFYFVKKMSSLRKILWGNVNTRRLKTGLSVVWKPERNCQTQIFEKWVF